MKMFSVKKKLLLAAPAVTGMMCTLSPMLAYAAEGDASAAAAAGDAVAAVTSISSLFTTYPMNVFLGFGIAAAAVGLFAKAKGASGGKKS